MALATGTLFEVRASATTGNVNGSGFNILNANFISNFTATSATGNAPVIATASYNFAAGDVGAWIYVKSGTNWTPGFYQISSVAANAATVNATIGAALQLNTVTNLYAPNTVAGVATTASPTGGTCGVDYSQQDTAQTTATDFTAVGASTNLTSVTAAFTPVMAGNFFHQTTTGTGAHGLANWFELVSYTNATTMVTDRTTNDGTTSVACTGFVGGAGRLNGLEDAYLEMVPAGALIYVKTGTYTSSAAISVASTNATPTSPVILYGYTSMRGDACNGTNRPVIAGGANAWTFGQNQDCRNLIFTSTANVGVTAGNGSTFGNCKFLNTSVTNGRTAWSAAANNFIFDSEAISQNGIAIASNQNTIRISGCYFHDSVTGYSAASAGLITTTLITSNTTNAILNGNGNGLLTVEFCTLYGSAAKIGTGINMNSANCPDNRYLSNLITGFTTGIIVATAGANSNIDANNNLFNNTTNATNWSLSPTSTFLDPQLVDTTELTGTGATSSSSTMTDAGANFANVTDNVDFLHIISATGATVGNYLILSHTATTVTVNNSIGTGSSIVYSIPIGHNYQIGSNLAGLGFPNFVNVGAETTSYPDTGAVQRQAGSGVTVGYSS